MQDFDEVAHLKAKLNDAKEIITKKKDPYGDTGRQRHFINQALSYLLIYWTGAITDGVAWQEWERSRVAPKRWEICARFPAIDINFYVVGTSKGFLLEMDFVKAGMLNRMTDKWWLKLLQLQEHADLQFEDSSGFTPHQSLHYPELFPMESSALYAMFRSMVAGPLLQDVEQWSCGLSFLWKFDTYSVEEVIGLGKKVFEAMMDLNKDLLAYKDPEPTPGRKEHLSWIAKNIYNRVWKSDTYTNEKGLELEAEWDENYHDYHAPPLLLSFSYDASILFRGQFTSAAVMVRELELVNDDQLWNMDSELAFEWFKKGKLRMLCCLEPGTAEFRQEGDCINACELGGKIVERICEPWKFPDDFIAHTALRPD